MLAFLTLFALQVFGASDSLNAYEKTFGRDNTYCTFHGKKVEFMIRGLAKHIDLKEMGYGEFLFYKLEDKDPKLLEINKDGTNTYQLLHGISPLCSKSHGYEIDSDTLAILFHRENRPYKDQLVIQLFDGKTMTPQNFIETDYATDKVMKSKDGFIFRTESEDSEREIGKVAIEGNAYLYQEKLFPVWINYSKKGLSTDAKATFEKFPWKKFFKDQVDFLKITGWNSEKTRFTNTIIYEAVNHGLRKRCVLFLDKKIKPVGNEVWRCQTM